MMLEPGGETLGVQEGLGAISQKMDLLTVLPATEFAQRIDVPPKLVDEFKWRMVRTYPRWLVDFVGKVGLHKHLFVRETASVTNDVGSNPVINNSCLEVRTRANRLFVVTTQDDEQHWRMYVAKLGDDGLHRVEARSFPGSDQHGAVHGNLAESGLEIKLEPLSAISSDGGPEYRRYARLGVRITGAGNEIKVRSLPVQLVREALNLPPKGKMEAEGYYYPSITPDEIEGLN